MLDEAGLQKTAIVASNSLDEHLITSLIRQGAPIDLFGVGENMITAKSNPVFGGVYKLVAMEKNNVIIPKIKISDNVEKVTNPHFKKIYRLYNSDNKLIADMLALFDEPKPTDILRLNHPEKGWISKEIKNYKVRDLKVKMIENGKVIYKVPTVEETRSRVKQELSTLWDEALRLENPHTYTVNLSEKLTKVKNDLLYQTKAQDTDKTL